MIIPIPAFKDNYIWMFFDNTSKNAWVVDPGDAKPVIATLQKMGLTLAGILVTHHHHDHSGGVAELLQHWNQCAVFGSHLSGVEGITHYVKNKDEITCGSVRLKIAEIPGHTLDHIAFYNNEVLFCGDTLFSAGCGRVFEGTPEQMYHSLLQLRALPSATKMYCGHEYTRANLNFAHQVEPNNAHIVDKMQKVNMLLAENKPTLPSTVGEEKAFNPFFRCDEPSVIHAVEKYTNKTLKNPADVFACLRTWKNNFS